MRRIILTDIAQNDLLQVARYTQTTWGKNQRQKYLEQFDQTLLFLAENPQLGLACNKIRSGYYKLSFQKHTIFYTFDEHQLAAVTELDSTKGVVYCK